MGLDIYISRKTSSGKEELMHNFLTKCEQLFKQLPCPKGTGDCQSCFKDGFYGGRDDYSCQKGCFYYAMHYGPAYISEVYHFLTESKLLEKVGKNYIHIASMGGGMGTDFWAIRQYIHNKRLQIDTLSYQLWDKEQEWQSVIDQYSDNLKVVFVDLSSQSVDFRNVDIVFLNKLFSTLKNHEVDQIFLTNFSRSLATLKKGAYIVFNDVNLQGKGRDDFHAFMMSSGNFSVQGQYYFPISNAYTGDYTKIPTTNIIYDCSSLSLSCDVMNSVRKTVFFYYRKEV
jgi:hypothetical protein